MIFMKTSILVDNSCLTDDSLATINFNIASIGITESG